MKYDAKKTKVPARYVEALGGKEPIGSMRKASERVRRLIQGLSEAQLARRPAPGKWSIKEVIAHLADCEVMVGSRVRMVASMDRPTLVGFDQDAFAANLRVDRARTPQLLKDFAAVRAANLALLARLPETAFDRVGLHTERGEESLRDMVVQYAGHDRIHEEQIRRTRASLAERKPAARRARERLLT